MTPPGNPGDDVEETDEAATQLSQDPAEIFVAETQQSPRMSQRRETEIHRRRQRSPSPTFDDSQGEENEDEIEPLVSVLFLDHNRS